MFVSFFVECITSCGKLTTETAARWESLTVRQANGYIQIYPKNKAGKS